MITKLNLLKTFLIVSEWKIMFSNANTNIATAEAVTANTRSASSQSAYNYGSAYTTSNMAAAHHHQNPLYQDYSMYSTMDTTVGWHSAAPHAAHMDILPNNDLTEASTSLNLASSADSNFLNNGPTSNSTSNVRPNSPSEYKVFNNNETRENEVKPNVRPSPDSGLAVSEAMSNSGSPNNVAGHNQNLVSQGSPIPGSNLVVRPSAARSPYEWMRKPSNGLQARPKEG